MLSRFFESFYFLYALRNSLRLIKTVPLIRTLVEVVFVFLIMTVALDQRTPALSRFHRNLVLVTKPNSVFVDANGPTHIATTNDKVVHMLEECKLDSFLLVLVESVILFLDGTDLAERNVSWLHLVG